MIEIYDNEKEEIIKYFKNGKELLDEAYETGDIEHLIDELYNYTVGEDGMDRYDNLTDSVRIIQFIHDGLVERPDEEL